MKIKIDKATWQKIGKKTGWLSTKSQVQNPINPSNPATINNPAGKKTPPGTITPQQQQALNALKNKTNKDPAVKKVLDQPKGRQMTKEVLEGLKRMDTGSLKGVLNKMPNDPLPNKQ